MTWLSDILNMLITILLYLWFLNVIIVVDSQHDESYTCFCFLLFLFVLLLTWLFLFFLGTTVSSYQISQFPSTFGLMGRPLWFSSFLVMTGYTKVTWPQLELCVSCFQCWCFPRFAKHASIAPQLPSIYYWRKYI